MTNKTPWYVWSLLIGIPLCALLLSYRELLLSIPDMELVDLPVMQVAYIDYVGPYYKTPEVIIRELGSLEAKTLKCQKVWGQYFDIPFLVDEDKQRSRLGCVLSEMPEQLPTGFKSLTIPARTYVEARRHTISPLTSTKINIFMLIFSAKNQMLQSGYIMELYDHNSDRLGEGTLLMPVSHNVE